MAPVRCSMPTCAKASKGSQATMEVSAPSMETSTCWPCPVWSACIRADRVPMTANSGASMSPTGSPKRTGPSSGSPAVSMTPDSAWMMESIALPEPGPPWLPKPLMEV